MTKDTKDVAVKENFAIMEGNITDITDMIAENIGDDTITMGDLTKIVFPSGKSTTWTIPDIESESGEIETKKILGVIVKTQHTRQYWETEYDGGNNPPDCASEDGITGIGTPGGNCMECPFSEFGSDAKERGKACHEKRLIFIVLKDDILPTIISAPASSLKNVRTYLFGLTSKRKFVHSVYTEVALVTDKNEDGIDYPKITMRKAGNVETPETTAAYAAAIRPFLTRTVRKMVNEPE